LDGPNGRGLPKAQVTVALRREGRRYRVFTTGLAVDERGEATGHLAWARWHPTPPLALARSEVVVVASHPGRVTQVERLPFSWNEIQTQLFLPPSQGATWSVSGRVLKPSGEPTRARLTIAPSILPDESQSTQADAEGAFTLEAEERLVPLFLASDHLEVTVDEMHAGGEDRAMLGIPQRDRPYRAPIVREPGRQPPLTITLSLLK
jgi:hypothetical protein